MDSSMVENKKTTTMGFMIAGLLLGIGTKVILGSLAAIITGPVGQILANEWVRHGAPVVVGLSTFIILMANQAIHEWGVEVASELRKVVWPSRDHTVRMTIFVCIMVLISGAALGFLDVVSGKLIQWLLSKNIFGAL